MTNEQTTTNTTQVERKATLGRRQVPEPIQVSDPQVADSLNKKTVGIRQYSDITDIQRIKKQNELNRQLVAINQEQLRQQMGLGRPAATAGDDAMTTTDQVAAGNEAADDHVQIGDTSYNISVGNPEQLQAVLDHLKTLKDGQQPQGPQEPQGPIPVEPVNTVITQPGTPVQVNPLPQQPAPQPATPPEPPKKTLGEKIMPWALAAATGLGAAGLTYGLTRGEPEDTDTRYRLEFDESEAPGQTIPVPKLQE